VVGLVALAWANRFIQDDAFISFRYAENLVAGNGLVWNAGEFVEGYTNFLWTLAMTFPFLFGTDPVLFSQLLGLGLFTITLAVTARVARRLFDSECLALVAVALLGTNYSFSSYATGGLETQLMASLWIAATALAVPSAPGGYTGRGLLGLGSVAAVALLARMDSAVWLAGITAIPLVALARERRVRDAALLVGPPAIVLALWFAWRLSYYGDLLPNTYYVKMASETSTLRGVYYVGAFLASYLLFPLAGVYAYTAIRRPNRGLWLLNLPLALWILYLIRIGGDFMEFRFIVPMLPSFFLAMAWTVEQLAPRRVVQISLVGLAILGSLAHGLTFDRSPLKRGFESIPRLDEFVTEPAIGWAAIGRQLADTFEPGDGVRIAVTPAGAIPFYSKLASIDMLGLNDRWIARHGLVLGDRPGHQRIAPISYLREREVHLVIGHPVARDLRRQTLDRVQRRVIERMFLEAPGLDLEALPAAARVVAIPTDANHVVLALYLTPHPAVEAQLQQADWRALPVVP
jgi:arabinofuranosyltransferase